MKKENDQICSYKHKELSISSGITWKICEQCQLIYSSQKKDEAYAKNEREHFDNFSPGNKYEFYSIINTFKKYSSKFDELTFFDFGCGAGGELLEAKKKFHKVSGFEPNKKLHERCISMSLDVKNNFDDLHGLEKIDVCFARNPFRYVDSFLFTIKTLISLIKQDGFFIWRDKYFDWHPKPNLGFTKKKISQSQTETYLFKDTIIFHLEKLGMKVLYKKFYYDDSFLIIAQKNNQKKFKYKKISNLIILNENTIELIHLIRKFMNNLKVIISNLFYFLKAKF